MRLFVGSGSDARLAAEQQMKVERFDGVAGALEEAEIHKGAFGTIQKVCLV
jgi:hypothetical protein